jgi:hypothetical protein
MSAPLEQRNLVIATRLHLGNATSPPTREKLNTIVKHFLAFCKRCDASHAAIAVDATPRVEGYDYVQAVQSAAHDASISMEEPHPPIHVLPVTPWGKFVFALNALIRFAAVDCQAQFILFVSAETEASASSVSTLIRHTDDATLVAGALLPGHDFHVNTRVTLTGRTTPWNTLAVWNVPKLALTGFPLVSDGVIANQDGRYDYRMMAFSPTLLSNLTCLDCFCSEGVGGVEEVGAIALLQRVLGHEHAVAKVIRLPDVSWDQKFDDEERRNWHERKMASKVERPARHLELTGLWGCVHHSEMIQL